MTRGWGAQSRHVFVVGAGAGAGGAARLRHGQPWLGGEGILDRFEFSVVAQD